MAHRLEALVAMPEGSSLLPGIYRIGRSKPIPTSWPLNLMSPLWLKHIPHPRPPICVYTLNKQMEMQLKLLSKKGCKWISFEISLVNSHANHRAAFLTISRLLKKQLCS